MNKLRLLGALCSCVLSSSANAYAILGTAWDLDGTVRLASDNPAPGGATWSIMGAGLEVVSGFDDHGINVTTLIQDLTGISGAGITLEDRFWTRCSRCHPALRQFSVRYPGCLRWKNPRQ